MSTFDINTDELIEFTAKLGTLHRSALPVAVRRTLNEVAFQAKSKIPKTAARKFNTRSAGFFRAFSAVNTAKGFDIDKMNSQVGINTAKGSRVAEGLAKQERGGAIRGRKLVPHDKGRVSNSHSKRVRRKNRFSNIVNITDSKKRTGKSNPNYLLIRKGSRGTVFEVKNSGRKRRLTPIYTYRNTRISRVQASPFIKPASFLAAKNMNKIYIAEGEKQIKRLSR